MGRVIRQSTTQLCISNRRYILDKQKTTCFGHQRPSSGLYLKEVYEWLHKVRNRVSVVRSHHPLCVGLIFYETKGRMFCCAQQPASRTFSPQFHKILAQHVVDDEISPLTRGCVLYVTTHKALLDKNLMMASNGRNMQFFVCLIYTVYQIYIVVLLSA